MAFQSSQSDEQDLDAILSFQDEEFIVQAYKVLLRREPDPEGFKEFVSRLRNGSLTKLEILLRICYSKEGRDHGITITGLRRRYLWNKLLRFPILGFIIRYILILLNLPQILKKINSIEIKTEANYTDLKSQFHDAKSIFSKLNYELNNIIVTLQRLQDRQQKVSLSAETQYESTRSGSQEHLLKILKEDDHLLDAMYVSFEDRFRGTRQDIKDRFREYLPYLKDIKAFDVPVIDLGCGRGEWLELLKEDGYHARGIDRNRVMIQQCKERGMDVVEADMIEYLRKQEAESLGAITGFHIAEHLPLEVLISLLDESFRALKPNGLLILETPNPENVLVGAGTFYIDPTHKNPIHPLTLEFLLINRGFNKCIIKKIHPYPDSYRLKGSEAAERMNEFFYGPQDYFIVGSKA